MNLRYWKNGQWHELHIEGGSYTAGDGIKIVGQAISADTDISLAKQGYPADAHAVGSAITSVSDVANGAKEKA